MRKILVTGITGFAGSFLAEELAKNEENELHGTYLSDSSLTNLSQVKDKIKLRQIDLTEYEEVRKYVSEISPDEIYHLAALPSPADSFKNPGKFLSNNINAELHILESLRVMKSKARVLTVASAEVYGLVTKEDLPIDELTPLRPVSPYGVSKITQDFLGLQYFLAHELNVLRVRPFGHVGPRLSDQFAASAFAKKIAEIESGKREPVLTVGNLNSRRDLTDVRDMVKAYVLVMEKANPGEVFNIGRGKSYIIQDILDILLSFSKSDIKVEVDENLLRPNDIPELVCDNSKIHSTTGWEPEIPIEVTLRDTLEYWRQII